MFLMQTMTVPGNIEINETVLYLYLGSFLVLAGVVWGVKQLIKLITRS
jgi:hypothetical protein